MRRDGRRTMRPARGPATRRPGRRFRSAGPRSATSSTRRCGGRCSWCVPWAAVVLLSRGGPLRAAQEVHVVRAGPGRVGEGARVVHPQGGHARPRPAPGGGPAGDPQPHAPGEGARGDPALPRARPRRRPWRSMREAIFINLSGNDGFTIAFYHRDPQKAQEVTDRLARLFIDETIKSREQQVEGAVDFLVTQVRDARTELENKDAALRRYKEEHMGRLPEQLRDEPRHHADAPAGDADGRGEPAVRAREAGRAGPRRRALLGGRVAGGRAGRGAAGAGRAEPPARRPAGPLHGRAPRRARACARASPGWRRAWPRRARARRPTRRRPAVDASASRSRASSSSGPAWRCASLEERQRDLEARIAAIRAQRRGDAAHGAGAGHPDPRLREAQRELHRAAQQAARGPDVGPPRAALEGRPLPDARSGEPAREAGLPQAAALPRRWARSWACSWAWPRRWWPSTSIPTVKDSEVLQAVQGYPVLAVHPAAPRRRRSSAARSRRPRAGPRCRGTSRAADGEPWGPSLPGEAPFRDEGIVTPAEGRADHREPGRTPTRSWARSCGSSRRTCWTPAGGSR